MHTMFVLRSVYLTKENNLLTNLVGKCEMDRTGQFCSFQKEKRRAGQLNCFQNEKEDDDEEEEEEERAGQ